MDFLNKTIQVNGLDIFFIATIILLTFIFCIYNFYKIKAFSKRQERFFKSFCGNNVEDSLNRFMDRVEEVHSNSLRLENYCNEIERRLLKCFQKIGVVRYNAFDNVGSDLSFAIALLDANDDGFVVNGVYSRDGSCTYAKPIINGTTKYVLSAEEMQAIDIAKKTVNKN